MNLISRIIHAIFDDKPMTEEEVARKLDALEKGGTERLKWRTSVVDLLKLLKLPSDMNDREALASELAFIRYSGSAADNETLRKAVMDEIAKRHVKIPPK